MQNMCEEMAFNSQHKSGLKIAQDISSHFHEIYLDKPTNMLTIPQLRSLVYRTRTKEFGTWEGLINRYPLNSCIKSCELIIPHVYCLSYTYHHKV
jgi:hypothetical protein